jgi:ADP-ribose pyrophosphatase
VNNKFERLSREIVYRSKWVNLFADRVIAPNGALIERYHIVDFEYTDVGCIVTNERNEVLLVKAYRYPTGTHGWEIPAGMVDSGEPATVAAAREVFEESGYHIHKLSEIHRYYPMNGISNKECILVRGEVDSNRAQSDNFDESEVSESAWFDLQTIDAMIKRNEIKCGLTLTALLLHLCNVALD